ncbi:E3 ubiquitin-protein ligase UHRF1-like, partial [Pteropus vampyrus]|uniref:E3 ubiquitin-protein ligase UHRF1-like n=1 Tax=Pteropus vampyrus TaxID=132908 RepID=A0A6P6C5J8_PTEVA
MQYPEGYLEALAKKEKEKENRKRAAEEEEEEDEDEDFSSPRKGKRKSKPAGGRTGAGSPGRTPKKTKVEPYSLTAQQRGLIREDQSNTKLWADLLKALKDGPVSAPSPNASA